MTEPTAPALPAAAKDATARGMAVFTCAVALFGCIDASAKWLISAGLAPLVVVFARYIGHLILILAVSLPQHGFSVLRSVNPRLQMLRSVALAGSTLFNFLALGHLPLSTTTSIMFSMPICVTLLSVPLLGERVTAQRMIGVVMGFAGVLVVVAPWQGSFSWAVLLSICSVMSASLYFILTRKLAAEANATHQIWSGGVACLMLAPFMLHGFTPPQAAMEWVVFGLIGFFGVASHSLATLAHRLAPASVLTPIVYAQLIFASLLGYAIFGAVPGLQVLLGGTIMVAAGLWLRRTDRVA